MSNETSSTNQNEHKLRSDVLTMRRGAGLVTSIMERLEAARAFRAIGDHFEALRAVTHARGLRLVGLDTSLIHHVDEAQFKRLSRVFWNRHCNKR